MENEKDLVVFQDDDGNEFTMEVLDYFFYEGIEYALLADVEEEGECAGCEDGDCAGCGNVREAYVMRVDKLEDDMEEFVPVDEELAQKLIEIVQNQYDFEDEEFEDEELEDEE